MENKILYQINSTLKSVVLKNQTINLLDSNLVNGLKFHKNTVSFTLELLPEQLKESNEIKKVIENRLLDVKEIEKVEEEENLKEKEQRENIEKDKNKSLGIEKDKKYGIQNFSCIKDEFALITISGQFNNDKIKKDKVSLEIMFLDHENNVILKNTANLLEIKEFETKRFLGNLKINEKFSTCTIKISN